MANHGYLVQIFNAYTTFEERASALSWCKTDDLDLVAIAHAIKNNKATENVLLEGFNASCMFLPGPDVQRSANALRCAWKSGRLWISFGANIKALPTIKWQGRKIKVFSDFWGKASLFFMEHYPHPAEVLKLGEIGLRKLSIQHNLKLRDTAIRKLLSLLHIPFRGTNGTRPELICCE